MRSYARPAGLLWLAVIVALAVRGLLGEDAALRAEAERIRSLIEQLGHDSFAAREAATAELERLGKPALPALRRAAVQDEELEVRQRAASAERTILLSYGVSRSTSVTLALIDPGDMVMGSPRAEGGRAEDEPEHPVHISRPFLLGHFEVTQEQFAQVMKFNPSWFQATAGGEAKVAAYETNHFPVERVTWYDAIAFCNQLSIDDGDAPYYAMSDIQRSDNAIQSATVAIRGGTGYRLPTEAEWEYACRAGSKTAYSYGAGGGNGKESNVKGIRISTYGGVVEGPNLERTTGVGSYRPNRWGLFDMHGNVAEWCWDWYGKDYYADSPRVDPAGPARGSQRVARGGSWLVGEASSRSASRLMVAPGESSYFGGFRVARSVP